MRQHPSWMLPKRSLRGERRRSVDGVASEVIMHCLHVILSFCYDDDVTGGFAGVRRR